MSCQLTIIVPVYNVAQYLRHCLQSLAEQGLDSYEVLLINDGSYDNSRGICSEWCEEHEYFRLINHDHNQGLSAARNTGIRDAKGDYITFVDSDDFVEKGTFHRLMNLIGNADVLEYPVMNDYLTDHATRWTPNNDEMDFSSWNGAKGFTHCYACNKIFRRSLWEGEEFPVGRYYEDIFTIPRILKNAAIIKGVDIGLYYYCHRSGSISTTPKPAALRDYTLALNQLLQFAENEYNTDLYIRALNAQLSYLKVEPSEHIIPYRPIPWQYVLKCSSNPRLLFKALWFKFTYHG